MTAFNKGAKFDGWSDQFDQQIWLDAMKEENLTFDMYNHREWNEDEILPWDIIDNGVSKNYLKRELNKAINGIITKDCRLGCNYCGIENCEMRIENED